MFRIGDFSKLSRISIRMLRHYHDVGLLIPDHTDDFTGYRYYHAAQLMVANRIQVLKGMGFGIPTIGQMLKAYDDEESLRKYLVIQHAQMKEEEEVLQKKLALLQNTILRLGKDCGNMNYDVILKEIPQRYVASLRDVIPAYDQEGELWSRLEKEVGDSLQFANPCYSIAVFHDEGYKDSDVDIEIQLSVTGSYKDTEHVRFKKVAPITVASAMLTGSYALLSEVNVSLANWISDHNYESDGSMFNIYHVGPSMEQNPNNWVTEVCYPVRKL
ncbi:MerR family transcriptional regulator [Paenibacillus antarcticus]|uniref:MerR family transcriptional regulator n=1 Tax=Paenibacillus antarcticus TaxID=253703 RepID=A0A168Q2S4_9BACL|nr:MerR family transcriptional regulator [Paenibacillus antarcticus]OAB47324.1 MerR family transcriptional regulator [Paenibacillus antarcticus]